MEELLWFVERARTSPQSVSLLPVLLELTYEQCSDLENLYASNEFWEGLPEGTRAKTESQHAKWAGAVKELFEFAAMHRRTVGPDAHWPVLRSPGACAVRRV
jgi:hypothetical protein